MGDIMNKIYINNITNYLILNKALPIGIGTTAICFLTNNNKIIKLFINTSGKREMFDYFSDMEKHLEGLNSISNDTFIGPEDILLDTDNNCIGYIFDYVKGKTLAHMKFNTDLRVLLNNYDRLVENTKEISDREYSIMDLHDKNIIINDNIKIIDIDRYIYRYSNYRDLFKVNINNINKTILYSLFGVRDDQIMYFYDNKLEQLYNKAIYSDYKYFQELIYTLIDYDVKTKGDVLVKRMSLRRKEHNTYYHSNIL